jgi:hypothetical protein
MNKPESDPLDRLNELAEPLGLSDHSLLPSLYKDQIRFDKLDIIRMWRPKPKRPIIITKQFKAKRNR